MGPADTSLVSVHVFNELLSWQLSRPGSTESIIGPLLQSRIGSMIWYYTFRPLDPWVPKNTEVLTISRIDGPGCQSWTIPIKSPSSRLTRSGDCVDHLPWPPSLDNTHITLTSSPNLLQFCFPSCVSDLESGVRS